MKKLLKRIMALSLCACMMMGAASPASAANIQPRYTANSFANWTLFVAEDTEGPVMNVYTWDTVNNADGNKVTTYRCAPGDPAQEFAVKWHPEDGAPRLYSKLGFNSSTQRGYTINCDRTSPVSGGYYCTTWNDNTYNRTDSEIDIRTQNYDLCRYRIYLRNRGLYLNDSGASNGAQLKWTSSTSSLWVNAN